MTLCYITKVGTTHEHVNEAKCLSTILSSHADKLPNVLDGDACGRCSERKASIASEGIVTKRPFTKDHPSTSSDQVRAHISSFFQYLSWSPIYTCSGKDIIRCVQTGISFMCKLVLKQGQQSKHRVS
jgi:hypothetical protein